MAIKKNTGRGNATQPETGDDWGGDEEGAGTVIETAAAPTDTSAELKELAQDAKDLLAVTADDAPPIVPPAPKPLVVQQVSQVPEAEKEPEFPETAIDSRRMHGKSLAELDRTPSGQRGKIAILKDFLVRLARHIALLESGNPPAPQHGANEIARHVGLNNGSVQAERVELRARNDKDIENLLAENEQLKKQLAEKKIT